MLREGKKEKKKDRGDGEREALLLSALLPQRLGYRSLWCSANFKFHYREPPSPQCSPLAFPPSLLLRLNKLFCLTLLPCQTSPSTLKLRNWKPCRGDSSYGLIIHWAAPVCARCMFVYVCMCVCVYTYDSRPRQWAGIWILRCLSYLWPSSTSLLSLWWTWVHFCCCSSTKTARTQRADPNATTAQEERLRLGLFKATIWEQDASILVHIVSAALGGREPRWPIDASGDVKVVDRLVASATLVGRRNDESECV